MHACHAPFPRAFARYVCLFAAFLAFGASEAAAEGPPPAICPAHHELPSQVRAFTCGLANDVAAGLDGSATFRALVDRIGELRGIVFIVEGRYWNPNARRVLNGVLEHRITWLGEFRVLHIRVALEPGNGPIATIAHELRHAIEVLESNAVTEAEIDDLFERIGAPAGARVSETSAATAAGRAVLEELARNDAQHMSAVR